MAGFYERQILPRCVDWVMSSGPMRAERARVAAPLSGTVLEIGFGTGLNLPFYPEGVDRVLAVDPATLGRRLARRRLEAAPFPVEFVGLDGEDIPLPDASVDAALCTWTLCTIPDPARALAEVRRILRPGGALHFIEHGRHPSAGVARWQDRLNPIQNACAGGCNLNRSIDTIVADSGLQLEALETYAMPGPRFLTWTYRGVARSGTEPTRL